MCNKTYLTFSATILMMMMMMMKTKMMTAV